MYHIIESLNYIQATTTIPTEAINDDAAAVWELPSLRHRLFDTPRRPAAGTLRLLLPRLCRATPDSGSERPHASATSTM